MIIKDEQINKIKWKWVNEFKKRKKVNCLLGYDKPFKTIQLEDKIQSWWHDDVKTFKMHDAS